LEEIYPRWSTQCPNVGCLLAVRAIFLRNEEREVLLVYDRKMLRQSTGRGKKKVQQNDAPGKGAPYEKISILSGDYEQAFFREDARPSWCRAKLREVANRMKRGTRKWTALQEKWYLGTESPGGVVEIKIWRGVPRGPRKRENRYINRYAVHSTGSPGRLVGQSPTLSHSERGRRREMAREGRPCKRKSRVYELRDPKKGNVWGLGGKDPAKFSENQKNLTFPIV